MLITIYFTFVFKILSHETMNMVMRYKTRHDFYKDRDEIRPQSQCVSKKKVLSTPSQIYERIVGLPVSSLPVLTISYLVIYSETFKCSSQKYDMRRDKVDPVDVKKVILSIYLRPISMS